MKEKENLKTLADIKTLMERSSRFLSLSGLSGIFIGCYALAGSIAAWQYLSDSNLATTNYYNLATTSETEIHTPFLAFFVCDALLVLLLSLITGYILTYRLAKKKGLKIWDAAAKRLLVNLLIPLVTGGIYCLILLQHNHFGLVAPSTLIFYGLSLFNVSKYTYNDLRYLGVIDIVLGLIAAIYTGYGLLLWAFGFGVIHIIYGIIMYYKYER
jgi:predicted lysophospholipase L1 biosynthesis ABC-type transport system permease subunit